MVPVDGVVPDDGVVLAGRVVAGVDWPADGVVDSDPPSAVVVAGPVVEVVGVVDVGPVVLVVDVEAAGVGVGVVGF